MEKRLFLAVVLTLAVILGTQLLLPGSQHLVPGATPVGDTIVGSTNSSPTAREDAVLTLPSDNKQSLILANITVDTVNVLGTHAAYSFSSLGGSIIAAEMHDYRALNKRGGVVHLINPSGQLVSYRIVAGSDTFPLNNIEMKHGMSDGRTGPVQLTFSGVVGKDGGQLELSYSVDTTGYKTLVHGNLTGWSTQPQSIILDLPASLESDETDSLEDQRHLAYAYKPGTNSARSVAFGSLSPGTQKSIDGPLTWVVAKNKYFLVAALAVDDRSSLGKLGMTGIAHTSKVASRGIANVLIPVRDGQFNFDLYVGPQQWEYLLAMGRDFQNANPYGGLLRGVVQPFAAIGVQVLLWAKERLHLSYGWVLIALAISVRLLLWPLNQGAMRSSLKAQSLEPLINDVRQRYKDDLEKQRTEIMRVYSDHGVNPLGQLVGCLPMLLPMPILFALFFVLQNTIEFRGVPFLWMPDISLRDPLYIAPLASGVTMFFLSWVGMRGVPPSPNAKVMLYGLPAMMTVLFLNFASGLNLYYAVQNIAGLPQQLIVARERRRMGSSSRSPISKKSNNRRDQNSS